MAGVFVEDGEFGCAVGVVGYVPVWLVHGVGVVSWVRIFDGRAPILASALSVRVDGFLVVSARFHVERLMLVFWASWVVVLMLFFRLTCSISSRLSRNFVTCLFLFLVCVNYESCLRFGANCSGGGVWWFFTFVLLKLCCVCHFWRIALLYD